MDFKIVQKCQENSKIDFKKSKIYKDAKTVKVLEEILRKKRKSHDLMKIKLKNTNFPKTNGQKLVPMETSRDQIIDTSKCSQTEHIHTCIVTYFEIPKKLAFLHYFPINTYVRIHTLFRIILQY